MTSRSRWGRGDESKEEPGDCNPRAFVRLALRDEGTSPVWRDVPLSEMDHFTPKDRPLVLDPLVSAMLKLLGVVAVKPLFTTTRTV